jgi:hypothetical protein
MNLENRLRDIETDSPIVCMTRFLRIMGCPNSTQMIQGTHVPVEEPSTAPNRTWWDESPSSAYVGHSGNPANRKPSTNLT